MSWVRIEDSVTEHPKHLKAGPAACWLWVCGIAYCQRQLTDGFIPEQALPLLGVGKGVDALAKILVAVGLFDRADGGYQVHDYFDFNAPRAEVLAKQEEARSKKSRAGQAGAKKRWHSDDRQIADAMRPVIPSANVQPSRSDGKPIAPSHPIPSQEEATASSASAAAKVDPRLVDRRSGRPIFRGRRIVVFEWMFDEFTKLLGPHTDAFGLDEWFYKADAMAMQETAIAKDWWPWLQSAFIAEAQSRGLRVVSGDQIKVAEQSRPRGCVHEPACADDAEHTKQAMADRRRMAS